jgi:hypothetical protein
VTAICALIVLYNTSGEGRCNDTLSIVELLRMTEALEEASSSSSLIGSRSSNDAYFWVEDNWFQIKKMSSKHLELLNYAPGRDDTSAWESCLHHVLKEQTGLNWRKKKNSSQFEVSQLSIWKRLGIEVDRYVDWYRSPQAVEFGLIKKSVERKDQRKDQRKKTLDSSKSLPSTDTTDDLSVCGVHVRAQILQLTLASVVCKDIDTPRVVFILYKKLVDHLWISHQLFDCHKDH